MMKNHSLEKICKELSSRDNYTIVGHAIPDGDCIGSMIAMCLGLKSMGKNADMLLQDPVPHIYRFLEGSELIKSYGDIVKPYENIIFLDCSDEERTGKDIIEMLRVRQMSFNIDHHLSNEGFADFNLVDTKAAAAAEIIYSILQTLQVDIDNSIAEAIYTGIVMDTGNFKYSSTSSKTLRIAADLLEKGINLDRLRINLYESKTLIETQLLGKALRSLQLSEDGSIAWMVLSYDDIQELGAGDVHPEGIINYTRMLDGVEVGILFREIEPGQVKLGFRSKSKINVAQLAAQFGGGGHERAAGAQLEAPLDQVMQDVIKYAKEVVK